VRSVVSEPSAAAVSELLVAVASAGAFLAKSGAGLSSGCGESGFGLVDSAPLSAQVSLIL
jgi:hypothetical protein